VRGKPSNCFTILDEPNRRATERRVLPLMLRLIGALICSIFVSVTSANDVSTLTPSARKEFVYTPGEGQVYLNNRIGTWVDAPIWQPNGSPPSPETMVQLMLVKPDGALEPLLPTTKFRSEGPPAGRFYFWGIAPSVPGVFSGDEATFRVRIWEGLDWESATLRGESQDITTVVGGGMATPPNLPLERFDLYPRVTLTLPAPVPLQSLQSAPKREVIIQTSTDLLSWERFYSDFTRSG
jgi:hypothetical protein